MPYFGSAHIDVDWRIVLVALLVFQLLLLRVIWRAASATLRRFGAAWKGWMVALPFLTLIVGVNAHAFLWLRDRSDLSMPNWLFLAYLVFTSMLFEWPKDDARSAPAKPNEWLWAMVIYATLLMPFIYLLIIRPLIGLDNGKFPRGSSIAILPLFAVGLAATIYLAVTTMRRVEKERGSQDHKLAPTQAERPSGPVEP